MFLVNTALCRCFHQKLKLAASIYFKHLWWNWTSTVFNYWLFHRFYSTFGWNSSLGIELTPLCLSVLFITPYCSTLKSLHSFTAYPRDWTQKNKEWKNLASRNENLYLLLFFFFHISSGQRQSWISGDFFSLLSMNC